MIKVPYSFMSDSILAPGSYNKIDVLTSCYYGLHEDVTDNFLVTTTTSYSHSLIYEILENVKAALLALCQRVLSVLNNYILNTVNLIDKYRELIKDKFTKLNAPLVYKTYEYPKLKNKDYPDIKYSSAELGETISALQDKIIEKKLTYDEVDMEIDNIIIKFGNDVIDGRVSPFDIQASSHEVVLQHIQGPEVTKSLTSKDLDTFINEIKSYKGIKDDLSKTKTAINKEYENLKKVYSRAMEQKVSTELNIPNMKNPGLETLRSYEYRRFADITMQMNRLFNAFITIYNEAFTTKLNVLQQKIEDNKNIITELLNRTGVLAAINAKSPSKTRKPLVYDPRLKM